MQKLRIVGLILAIVFGLSLAGCATRVITGATDVDRTAFGAKKRFALVSVASHKTFQGEKGLTQLFKDTDNIAGANTQPLINSLRPKIVSALGASKNFMLLPVSRVLTTSSYKNLTDDPRVVKVLVFTTEINVANNYKYVSDAEKFAKLARDLKVDGVIGITVNFPVSAGSGGLGIYGLSFGRKSYSAMAMASAIAYNANGDVIWKDSTTKEAEPGDTKAIIAVDTTGFTGTDFEKLHPSAVEIGGKAVDVLLARFDDTMAGKTVDRIQSVK